MDTIPAEVFLADICKTPARITLLMAVLKNPTMSVSAIATRTGMTKGMVSRYLSILEAEGILVREKRGYRLVESPLVIAIRQLLNILLLRRIVSLPEWAWGIGVYGSWGKGTNTEESDLDIWIYAERPAPPEETGRIMRTIRKSVDAEVHLLLLTPERIRQIRENDEPFYESLVESMKIIRGESFVHA